MKRFVLICFCLALGAFAASSAAAKTTPDELRQLLRDNPGILMDVLPEHSEELLGIVQDGAIKRRTKNVVTGWQKDLEKPKNINLDGHIIRGNPDAPVTVVSFSDFTCPYCQRGAEEVRKLMLAKGDKVRFIFKHFPREDELPAMQASQSFIAAGLQSPEQAWVLYDLLFQNEALVLKEGEEAIKRLAASAGLDMKRLAADLKNNTPAKIINADIAEALRLGVEGTPTFFINDLVISGVPTSDLLNQAFDMVLKAASAPRP